MASTLTYVMLIAVAFCMVAWLTTEICRESDVKPGLTLLLSQAVLFATVVVFAGWATALSVAGTQAVLTLVAKWIQRQAELPSPSMLYRWL